MSRFLKKILAAGRLVKSGKVTEATAAIQQALALASAPSQARAHTSAPSGPSSPPVATIEPARMKPAWTAEDVIDVEPDVVVRPAGARFEESSFTCAAGTRSFKLYEPPDAGATPRPLVVMLHGCTQSPDDFAAGTRMNELAAAEGVYVLYPAQAPRSNAHKCWNWFVPGDQRRGDGEPALLAGMTRHVMQVHAIDADRVYVAGLSAGGAMAAILAREYPDLFAAAGIHSGIAAGGAHDVASAFAVMKGGPAGAAPGWQMPGAASTPLWPAFPTATAAAAPSSSGLAAAPVIVFHGDADSTVAAANGDAVIAAALAAAGESRRSDTEGPSSKGERTFRRSVWRDAQAPADAPSVAEQWIVRGAPHAWSGGAAQGSYTDPAGPDASREMLRFFLEHPRRPAAA
jgi:poly(hydroxyalkanoate) depolymerase family esterase